MNAPNGFVVTATNGTLIDKGEVLARLDLAAAFSELGIEFTKAAANSNGWRECRAFGRDDRHPSAGVNVRTGHYRDHGEGGESLDLFGFAMKHGRIGDGSFKSVLRYYAEKAGVMPATNGRGQSGQSGQSSQSTPDASDTSDPSDASTNCPAARPRVGYPTPDLAARHATPAVARQEGGQGWKLTRTWTYSDKDGTPHLVVARYDRAAAEGDRPRKTYRPFHVEPPAGWIVGDPPGKLPLYDVPKLIGHGGAVALAEGEKCCDLLNALGFTATTTAHGANSVSKSDVSPLAGRDIYLLPDAGAAGAVYERDILEALGKLSPRPSVRIVRLPGLNDGEDIEEWLESLPDSWDDVQVKMELEKILRTGEPHDFDRVDLPSNEELGIIRMADVEEKPIEWHWEGFIPTGMLTLLVGPGDVGKSYMTTWLAAATSRGGPYPNDPDKRFPRGTAILLNAEDDLARTIKPRLTAMGADCDRVIAIGTGRGKDGKPRPFSLDDIERLEQIAAKNPDANLLVVDPVTAFLGRGVDDHKNAELRRVLGPLKEFAEKHRVAVVCITHFNKSSGPKAVDRVLGSVAYSNAARVAFMVVLDPENSNRRIFNPYKFNIGPDKLSMAYTIDRESHALEWEQNVFTYDSDELLMSLSSKKKEGGGRERAGAWLKEFLAAGPKPSDDVIKAAVAAGFSRDIMFAVKAAAGARARKMGFSGRWEWILDEPAPPNGQSAQASEGSEASEASGDDWPD